MIMPPTNINQYSKTECKLSKITNAFFPARQTPANRYTLPEFKVHTQKEYHLASYPQGANSCAGRLLQKSKKN